MSKQTGVITIPARNGEPEITNAMKAACIGEFSWTEDARYYDEEGNLVEHEATREVPWRLVKEIYKRMATIAAREAKPK